MTRRRSCTWMSTPSRATSPLDIGIPVAVRPRTALLDAQRPPGLFAHLRVRILIRESRQYGTARVRRWLLRDGEDRLLPHAPHRVTLRDRQEHRIELGAESGRLAALAAERVNSHPPHSRDRVARRGDQRGDAVLVRKMIE